MAAPHADLRRWLPLVVVLLVIALLPALAQQQLSPAMQTFAGKDYAGYLTGAAAELAGVEERPLAAFSAILVTAVALEKTQGWGGASGKQVAGLLAKSPDAARYLGAVKLLLQGNTDGLTKLFDGAAPSPDALGRGARILREHGFPLAADCLLAVSPDMPGKRVQAWLSVPKDKRAPVAKVMEALLDIVNMRQLGEMALAMYIKPPPDLTVDRAELLAFARQYGSPQQVVSLDTIERLIQYGHRDDGLQIAGELAAAKANDPEVQTRVARIFWSNGRLEEAGAMMRASVGKVPSPEARDMRLAYLGFLDWLGRANRTIPNQDTIPALANSPDHLLAGDASYALQQLPQAAKHFLAVAADDKAPLEKRLDAWSGLLDTDPASAMPIGSQLLDRVLALQDPAQRLRLAVWMGWELSRPLQHEVTLPAGSFYAGPQRPPTHPLRDAGNWQPIMAAMLEKIVALEPGICLRADPRRNNCSLRMPLAIAYILAHEDEKAAELLLRRVTYQIPPPPGGWKHYDGTLMPDANEPREEITPREGESTPMLDGLFTGLRRCPAAVDDVAPLAAYLARGTAAELKSGKLNDGQIKFRLQTLQLCISTHAFGQDPPVEQDNAPRPERPADMNAFAVLDAAVRDALAQDAVVKGSLPLWQDAFLPAILTVRDPKLVDGYFNLLTLAFDRYAAVTGKASLVATSANILAKGMDDYKYPPRPDLKPYAQRLREKYPKK